MELSDADLVSVCLLKGTTRSLPKTGLAEQPRFDHSRMRMFFILLHPNFGYLTQREAEVAISASFDFWTISEFTQRTSTIF